MHAMLSCVKVHREHNYYVVGFLVTYIVNVSDVAYLTPYNFGDNLVHH